MRPTWWVDMGTNGLARAGTGVFLLFQCGLPPLPFGTPRGGGVSLFIHRDYKGEGVGSVGSRALLTPNRQAFKIIYSPFFSTSPTMVKEYIYTVCL